jgi:hypothetical protein
MNISFTATFFTAASEDDVLTVGFADDEYDPRHFLLLQAAAEYDEQDKALGLDTYDVQIGEPELAGYGGVDTVLIAADKLVFCFSDKTPWCKEIRRLDIFISPDMAKLDDMKNALRAVFAGSPTVISRV